MQRFLIILAYFFILPIVFGTIGSANCFAQQFPFVHYTPKDGLVNSRVKKAYQDSKGRMYFLTYGGLSVFDGARFRNYTIQNGLPVDLVNDILEVGNDSLLVATNTGGLNVLVRGKITSVKTEGDPCPLINQFYLHDKNKIYLASDNGLFILENKKIRELDVSLKISKSSTELPYLGNISGSGNYLILTTNDMESLKGLFLYDIINNRICDVLLNVNPLLLGKDKNGRVWVSMSHKLFIMDPAALAKGKILLIPPTSGYIIAKNYSVVNMIFGKECIWVMYRDENFMNKEVRRIDESGSIFSIHLSDPAIMTGTSDMMIDRENSIWLSNDAGIFKIVNSPLQFFESPFGKSTPGYVYNAFYVNNVTWYSTNTNKLFRKSQQGIDEFSCNLKESPEIFHDDGEKLLAHDYRNIYESDLSNKKGTIYFYPVISLPDSDFFVNKQIVDYNGNIIAAQKTGLVVWKNNKQIFHLLLSKEDIIDGLTFDKNNFLWVLKRYSGIDVFSLHPENISKYLQPVLYFPKEQITGSPRCLIIDKSGLIWIGSREDGVVCYKQDDRLRKLYQFNAGNGLTDNFVTSLACDSLNNIIAGTQTGLDRILRYDANSFRIENLSKSSNFFAMISQCWADVNHAYARSSSGALLQLSLPTMENRNNAPQLLLEEMRVNAKPVLPVKKNFKYKENNISFLVAAPSFIDEKQIAFSYLLEGSGNDQWSDTTPANTVINLINLSAGKYVLKVKAFFPSAIYAPSELSYSFEITPPWWQTWWFRSIAGLLIIGLLIIGLRFYYRRKLEKQMAVLEKQQAIEKERTRIATDMHDDLGAGLSKIKFLSETIGIKKQQQLSFEEDISKIREYSHDMIDKMGEIVWALNEKNDSLNDLLSYSRSYAVEYLSQSGIECNVEIPDNFPTVFVSGEFRRNIYLTLKEALHNIVKHAQASHVNITIGVNHNLAITIQDDGIGFDKNKIRPFSNGLSNMEKRMKDIGGKIEIKNNEGTLVKLEVPFL